MDEDKKYGIEYEYDIVHGESNPFIWFYKICMNKGEDTEKHANEIDENENEFVFARLNDLTRQLSIENVHDQEDEQLYSKFVQVIFKSNINLQQEKADVVPETEQKHHF